MFLRFNLILTFILLVSANPLMAQNTLEDSVEYLTSNLLDHPKSKGLLLNKSISFFDVGSHTIKNNGSFCSVDSLDFFVRAISEMGKKSTSFPLQWAKQSLWRRWRQEVWPRWRHHHHNHPHPLL
jgi:hypothetical protein